MPESPPQRDPSPLESTRRLGATALELLSVRAELLDAEWAAEKRRLGVGLFFCALAAGVTVLSLAALGVLVTLLTDSAMQVPVMSALALVYLLIAALAAWKASRALSPDGGAIPLSLGELERDIAALRGEQR